MYYSASDVFLITFRWGDLMNKQDLVNVMFYGFRYALGRSTYCVSDVANFLINNQSKIDKLTRAKIVEEIEEAIKEGEAGQDIDVYEWKQVLIALRK